MEILLDNRATLLQPPRELKERIKQSLTLPNPIWQENQRRGRWNRGVDKDLHFYVEEEEALILPRGCMRLIITACRQEAVPFTLTDHRRTCAEVSFDFTGRLRPFQKEACQAVLKKEFGVLTAPTGAGKTVMALYLVAERRQPTLIVVHTKDLARQWIARIGTFLGIPEKEVGLIGGGTFRLGEKVTVAMVQSLYKRSEEVASTIGYLIVDECHRAPSRTFTEAVSRFDAHFMTGLSATPWRRDKLSRLIFFHLGESAWKIDKSPLIEEGHLLRAEVRFRLTPFYSDIDGTTHYAKLMAQLTGDTGRNALIVKDIFEELPHTQGTLLILSDRKAHCENMRTLLHYNHGVDADLITGDLTKSARSDVLERLEKGEVKVLFATSQLLGEGFDAHCLATLFLTYPIRFSGRLLQYLGRVLRPGPGKEKALIVDYVDVEIGILESAARARLAVYQSNSVAIAPGTEVTLPPSPALQ
ncbi:DEAD/DEAH box helicase [Desulfoluna sp.]|uniref:DEAD/DEAH box helicase n=1 Tax=Desulfoluna sp. TaxID=2045199 RepID=UPI002631237A|nr:DEAD/DEAH box helicase [Desulfoluna sp.]